LSTLCWRGSLMNCWGSAMDGNAASALRIASATCTRTPQRAAQSSQLGGDAQSWLQVCQEDCKVRSQQCQED
jgi:hypothetical protein